MHRFLKLGTLAIAPLTAISIPYLRGQVGRTQEMGVERTNLLITPKISSITLISKDQKDFKTACSPLPNNETSQNGNRQSFNDPEKLLSYLFADPTKLAFENVRMSFPREISQLLLDRLEADFQIQHRQQIGFQRSAESLEEANKLFQALWKQWISDWSFKGEESKAIIFGEINSKTTSEKDPKFEKLYKCYDGHWYSVQFNSAFDFDTLETINFKNWISNHIGIL